MSNKLTIQLPAPHSAQRQVLAEAKRFNVLACGRRWGKSTLGIDRIVKPALEGFPTAWFAPGYKSLLEIWRSLQQVLEPVIVGRNNAEFRLELRGGGSVVMFSLDSEVSESSRGRAFRVAVIDEAALVPGLLKVWETAIRPTLADYRGDAWFLSTPRGMNDFRSFFARGQDPEREDWASWQMPTSTNPYIHSEEIEAARRDMTEAAFAQEFLAQFVSWEGAVFRRISEASTAQQLDGPEARHEYVIGCDWGRSHDYTVFIVLDVTDKRMVAMDRSNKVDYAVQRGRLGALNERWKPSTIIAELNSIGQPIIEQLERDGLRVKPFTTTNASKAQAIEALALAFERGEIRILNDVVLLGELQAFQAEQLPSGLLRYSAPGGCWDDCVMALAMAWTAIGEQSRNCLGLVEYLRTTQAEIDALDISAEQYLDNLARAARVDAKAKLVTQITQERATPSDPTMQDSKICPKCGSTAIVSIPGNRRCNQCGNQNVDGKSPAPKARGSSRYAELEAKDSWQRLLP